MTNEKQNEERFRGRLARRGFLLRKSRSRTPEHLGYGGYLIMDVATNSVVAGAWPYAFSMDIGDVEAFMAE